MSLRGLFVRVKAAYYKEKIKRTAAYVEGDIWLDNKSYVTEKTYLKKNVNFNGMAISGNGKVSIGQNFHSGINCQIITSFHDYDHDDSIPYGTHFIDKDVEIKDNVWIGNNVIVLGGTKIGEGVIVQAGSVVAKDIPDFSIAGGHPAKVFKKRDIDHYERLKMEGKFH